MFLLFSRSVQVELLRKRTHEELVSKEGMMAQDVVASQKRKLDMEEMISHQTVVSSKRKLEMQEITTKILLLRRLGKDDEAAELVAQLSQKRKLDMEEMISPQHVESDERDLRAKEESNKRKRADEELASKIAALRSLGAHAEAAKLLSQLVEM